MVEKYPAASAKSRVMRRWPGPSAIRTSEAPRAREASKAACTSSGWVLMVVWLSNSARLGFSTTRLPRASRLWLSSRLRTVSYSVWSYFGARTTETGEGLWSGFCEQPESAAAALAATNSRRVNEQDKHLLHENIAPVGGGLRQHLEAEFLDTAMRV